MAISSLISKLFQNGNGHADPCALIDRITSSIYSSVEINNVLKLASAELGRALEAARLAVMIFEESPACVSPDYHAPDLESHVKELLRSINAEVARSVESATDIRELVDTFAAGGAGHPVFTRGPRVITKGGYEIASRSADQGRRPNHRRYCRLLAHEKAFVR